MTAAISAAIGARQRNVYLDVLRALALARVVTYHTFESAWLAWVFPAIGVMFALAGSLMARSLAGSAKVAVRNRIRRLLPALWLFGLVVVPVMVAHGWTTDEGEPLPWYQLVFWILPVLDPPGSAWGADLTVALWYIRAYLWFVLLSPVMLIAFRRWPLPTILAPLLVVAAAEFGVVSLPDPVGAVIGDFATFGACWLLGFAHQDGTLRRIPVPVLLGLAGAVAAAGAAWALTHPATDTAHPLDLNEIPLAQALWSLGFVAVLLRFPLDLAWLARTPVLGRLVAIMNARAVTIYLWHNAVIVVCYPVIDRLVEVPFLERIVEGPVFLYALVWILLAGVVLAFGWVEDLAARRRPQFVPGRRRERPPPEPMPASPAQRG